MISVNQEFVEETIGMQNFGLSMLFFWVCYILVTLVGVLHTVFNIYVLHMKPMDDKSMGEGYENKALASII